MLHFAASADQVLVVTAPEPTAVTDGYAIIKVLSQLPYKGSCGLLVNFASDRNEARMTYQRVSTVARQFLGMKVLDAGYVLTDPKVRDAVRKREPFVLCSPRARRRAGASPHWPSSSPPAARWPNARKDSSRKWQAGSAEEADSEQEKSQKIFERPGKSKVLESKRITDCQVLKVDRLIYLGPHSFCDIGGWQCRKKNVKIDKINLTRQYTWLT